MTEELFRQLASTGIVGVLLGLSLLALREKDRQLKAEMQARIEHIREKDLQLKAEMQARIEDAGKFNALSMALQREVIAAVGKLGEMLDHLERRDAERQEKGPRGGSR